MTYAQFEQAWIGRRVDYDGVANFQCVDLVKQYLAQVFGVQAGSWGNAIDYWYKTNPAILAKFTKVSGTSPQAGDIVVFETNITPIQRGKQPGHIAIATGKQNIWRTQVEVLEQNGATGDGDGRNGDEIRKRYIAKSRIAGLLSPAQVPQALPMPAVGAVIKLIPVQQRTTFRAGTTQGAGVIYAKDNTYTYVVRGYDPVYKNRILINSQAAGGDGVALALFYTDGKRIPGWETV